MIYRSNLTCPDLTPHFKHMHSRPMPHSMGHDVPSDWADKADDDPVFGLYKKCGMWTHDEAAILYNVAKQVGGDWLDVGSHTGWTSAHIKVAAAKVVMLDPMYGVTAFEKRALDNMRFVGSSWWTIGRRSDEYFDSSALSLNLGFNGCVIDGDHDPPHPLRDAQNCAEHLMETGVILTHDFIGQPVWGAVVWLMDHGFKCRVYWTPHMVACCWRGDFTPPNHVRDSRINWDNVRRTMQGFPFERTV